MRSAAEQALDELLVLRCQEGDGDAMDELVRRWQPRFIRHAWHLTRHADAAWDVTQESWLGIVRGIGRLDDPALFRAWAYRIVTHKCADWIKRRRNERRAGDCVADVADAPPSPLQAQDEARQLHDAIRHLSSDQRAILSLKYWEEMTMTEIAAALEVPEGTVKSRLNQARNELKQILERTIT